MIMNIFLTPIKFSLAFLSVLLSMIFFPGTVNYINTYYAFFVTVCIAYVFFYRIMNQFFNNKKQSISDKRPTISKKIYVAGSWKQRHQLNERMEDLRSKGYTVTSYWPGLEDRLNNPDDYGECSKIDINGVIGSDTILMFMTDPMHPYCGTFTEMGCAIGSGKRIILICDGKCTVDETSEKNYKFTHCCMQSVFFWDHRIEHVSTYEDALELLKGGKIKSPFHEFYNGKTSKKLSDYSSGLKF